MILPVESPRRLADAMRKALLPLATLTVIAMTLAMTAEILLRYRAGLKEAYRPRTHIDDLDRAYREFTIQHLHPHYLFFFPLDPVERLKIGNDVVRIDREGFREPGPQHAGTRRVAVMLGGSSAFGQYASSDQHTITSFLNRLQDEYFFVNAAVPSWNSTQELMRLTLQIVDMKPALILAYDGSNDAALSVIYSPRTGLAYPPGTPESFDDLERWVDDIRADRWLIRLPPLFPELRHRFDKFMAVDQSGDGPIPDEGVAAAARQYRINQQRMSTIASAAGARFISVFQPVASMHRNVPPQFREGDEGEQGRRFYRFFKDAGPVEYEFHDLSNFFDSRFALVPAGEPTGPEQPIFVDDVHLYDRGNEIVARQLWALVQARPAL
jgi:hypothetical protein